MTDGKRWHVEFRFSAGLEYPPIDIDEINELQDILEDSPDWGCLIDVVITYLPKEAAAERGKVGKLS